jgi:hypothetical protein
MQGISVILKHRNKEYQSSYKGGAVITNLSISQNSNTSLLMKCKNNRNS